MTLRFAVGRTACEHITRKKAPTSRRSDMTVGEGELWDLNTVF
jgi:hypothetical protein